MRRNQDLVGGKLDAALTDVGTTMSSPALGALIAVASPDYVKVVLNPDGIGNNAPEIVYVTAHTASATSATISRGEEGTTAVAHPTKRDWVAAITARDMDTPPIHTVAATGAAETIQWGMINDLTMDENCTFDFATVPFAGEGAQATVIVRGAFTPSWDAAVDWPDATAPTYSTPTVYEFVTVDDATTILGWSTGKAFG